MCSDMSTFSENMGIMKILYHRLCISVNRGRNILKIIQPSKWQTREGDAALPGELAAEISGLESHGTTSVFCETDPIGYSWFYQPSSRHDSHRFICTGNFADSNNAPGKMTCTVEFTDEIPVEEIKRQLLLMPYHPRYLAHHFSPCSYPIQHSGTRQMIETLKQRLARHNIGLVGRFAEWEYHNMDAAIASAMRFAARIGM